MTADIESEALPETAFAFETFKPTLTTPAGLQAIATLNRRRAVMFILNAATWVLLLAWAGSILSAGLWTMLDVAVFLCLALGTPWTVLGFWNAVIGFWQLRRHSIDQVAPFLDVNDRAALTIDTAVLMTLRNEDAERALRRLQTVKASLDATGHGAKFAYFVLSDTNVDDIVRREEVAVAAWKADEGDAARIVYRRRLQNTGYKAGNVRDFCRRFGGDFELMLPLDADSLMTGPAITRMVRIMQCYPKLGILQSLVVGAPASSAFARIFQFGMRLGMRTYTMGQAWWVGDCGPFWGHNALVRIKPFIESCEPPILPGKPPLGGDVLSHDQVEAALMRRAGYEVRVMPLEDGSYEDNPPDILTFMRRDVRWCQGNMQYLKLIGFRGLEPVSRFQLTWAVLMFVGVPAWTVMIALLPFTAMSAQSVADFPVASAEVLYVTLLLMYLTPKLAGLADALLMRGEVERFGGWAKLVASAVVEIVFSFLLGAITTIRTSLFMLGLPFGKSIVWSGQRRDAEGVSWRDAAHALWPQLVFGLVVCGALLAVSPQTLVWSLPLTAGYLLAIPFTVLTANARFGDFMRSAGIAAIPEDFAPPLEIQSLQQAVLR